MLHVLPPGERQVLSLVTASAMAVAYWVGMHASCACVHYTLYAGGRRGLTPPAPRKTHTHTQTYTSVPQSLTASQEVQPRNGGASPRGWVLCEARSLKCCPSPVPRAMVKSTSPPKRSLQYCTVVWRLAALLCWRRACPRASPCSVCRMMRRQLPDASVQRHQCFDPLCGYLCAWWTQKGR